MIYICLIVLLLSIFIIIYLVNPDLIIRNLPWIWKNIAKPIFQYFFVTTVRKITICYFSVLSVFAIANPILKLCVRVDWKAENRNILVCLDWSQDWIDYMSLGIATLATIAYVVFILYEFRKLREPSYEILDAIKDSD